LYGLISYVVARRTNEIGVRLALGARPSQVEALVVRGALRLTIAGLAVGALGALAFARVLGSLLYGVAPWDPLAYLGAIFVLGVVALLAGWLPARRAAQVDPAVALRSRALSPYSSEWTPPDRARSAGTPAGRGEMC
jgi:ABC-type antimicrobial peptide transport system permease subunit